MAVSIETGIEIHAPLALVWGILRDFPRYGEWNPLVVRAAGPFVPGEKSRYRCGCREGRRWLSGPLFLFWMREGNSGGGAPWPFPVFSSGNMHSL